jgi:hypothetical protein
LPVALAFITAELSQNVLNVQTHNKLRTK